VTQLVEFYRLFSLYARHHNPIYAARIAYQIVYRGMPF
jgi:hypothetical protein